MSKILRKKDVLLKTGLSKSTIYDLILNKKFPTQLKLSKRSVGWLESEVDQWIKSKSLNN